ncbi:hypothetical protein L1987_22861 [Smallanthus sonchifolius]|uniref:Uncharacterized protein n=1 Tax=Smallanthus sonchifolius TaxID=185202 RepID=A0ACB9IHE4_9ASTR|nr:hypothetical protein L1987_22861 [Smallanthus sonchifolius]
MTGVIFELGKNGIFVNEEVSSGIYLKYYFLVPCISEAQEELKRLSDASLRRENEKPEIINKLQESEKERCSLVETLRSKLEDARQKLVGSDNKVRQLESQLSQEQRVSSIAKKIWIFLDTAAKI